MTDDELLSVYSVGYASADAPSERHMFGVRAVEAHVRRALIQSLPDVIMAMFSDDLGLDYSFADINERVRDTMLSYLPIETPVSQVDEVHP